ncbi:hypothetical protein J7L13_03265 [bacterium]|nr:hypothetical protein [bacterium]
MIKLLRMKKRDELAMIRFGFKEIERDIKDRSWVSAKLGLYKLIECVDRLKAFDELLDHIVITKAKRG